MTCPPPTDPWIALPDGRRLAARLWRPETDRPAPAILEYLPYRKRDGTAPRDATTHPVFAAAGYACVRVDVAGTGDSDGLFGDEYSEQELSDGEAVIAWIARQPWCDGNVGMIGISWGGFNGLQLAARRPPALKAVVTCCSSVDRYADDIHYMGGCLLTDNFNWGAQMLAYQSRPPDPALRDDWRERWIERIETLPFLAARWLEHPARDAYWRHGSVCEDWSAIEAAVLAVGGWADAYVNAPPALAANLSAPVKALIGPWEHKYPHIARIGPADFHGEVVGWFDRWLKGERNGAERLPAFRAFIQEHDAPPSPLYGPRSGRWVGEAVWPSPNVVPRVLHLGAAGGLSAASPGSHSGEGVAESASVSARISAPLDSRSGEGAAVPARVSAPPDSRLGEGAVVPARVSASLHGDSAAPDPSPGEAADGRAVVATPHHVGVAAACFCPGMRIDNELAADQAPDDAASVCFDTDVLEAPLELLGRPVVEIAFSADRPAAQLCFRLCDVAPGGASQRITWRAFNLTHHAGSESPAALDPGRIYRARIALNACAHRLLAGHRLRLAVSTSYWPVVWPAPAAAAVTLHLAHCRLVLPERRISGEEIDPAAPGDPADFPVQAAEILREPANRTERRIDPDGTHVLETFDDFGASRDPDHGLETGSHVAQRYSIHPDDPLSARHEARWRYELQRGDWSVRIDSRSVMTSDADSFHLAREVTAREGDTVVIARSREEDLPRGLS